MKDKLNQIVSEKDYKGKAEKISSYISANISKLSVDELDKLVRERSLLLSHANIKGYACITKD